MFECVIFDFDGTLVDTSQGIFNAVNYALKALDLPQDRDPVSLSRMVGPPLRKGFADNYGITDEAATVKYREYYADKGCLECTPYGGMAELLTALKNRGVRLAVATLKPEDFTVRILEHLGWTAYFDAVAGAALDGSLDSKAALIGAAMERLNGVKAERTVMVGDRAGDMQGGKQYGLATVFCRYGFAGDKDEEGAGADGSVNSVEELSRFLLDGEQP